MHRTFCTLFRNQAAISTSTIYDALQQNRSTNELPAAMILGAQHDGHLTEAQKEAQVQDVTDRLVAMGFSPSPLDQPRRTWPLAGSPPQVLPTTGVPLAPLTPSSTMVIGSPLPAAVTHREAPTVPRDGSPGSGDESGSFGRRKPMGIMPWRSGGGGREGRPPHPAPGVGRPRPDAPFGAR